ncbi:MAG: beta-ketoacyl synthase chain length factor, partial [Methylococcaceae bacterium]|nr:beta-ketoacyl synthase chain length factor [Methylococcaceae bacterium]
GSKQGQTEAPANGNLSFTLEKWCLWREGENAADGRWPGGTVLPSKAGGADVSFLPMMQRRRLSPLAKAAIAVAWNCRDQESELPTVFYSAHGESHNYFALLSDLADAADLSPSGFSHSVHNAIAGLYTLYSGTRSPYLTLAGGPEGLFSAFLEAAGLLLETSYPKVLLVWYEQALPEVYRSYVAGPSATLALAMRLGRSGQGGLRLHLKRTGAFSPACDLEEFGSAILQGKHQSAPESAWHWNLSDV